MITMYGADWCSDCRRSKSVLDRLEVEYDYIDIERVDGAADAARDAAKGRMNIPVIVFPDGAVQIEPTDPELSGKLAELGLAAV
jgi:mycoredoxin